MIAPGTTVRGAFLFIARILSLLFNSGKHGKGGKHENNGKKLTQISQKAQKLTLTLTLTSRRYRRKRRLKKTGKTPL
jgi:hypothetical protein